jgi:hypothetical protein
MYPHWIVISRFVSQWYTLPTFVIAMLIAVLELWYLASKLHRHIHFTLGANALYASALCVVLTLCIPYTGSATHKDMHNLITLLFVLFAASGFALIAKQLRSRILGMQSGVLFAICVLELVFLARHTAHPVYSWVWPVLELSGIAMLIAALYIIAATVDRKTKVI